MYRYSEKSQFQKFTCHPDLQKILNELIKEFDCTVLSGHRGQKEQDYFFKIGTSKKYFPNSKHNKDPSMAVDVVPYPYDDKDIQRYILLAGRILGIAQMLYQEGKITHRVRWGGDWNKNNIVKDDGWDFGHFELIN